jgi:hypothetical protein
MKRYEDEDDTIYVPIGKPRNPHVKELYDGTHKGGKHAPPKERFKTDYEAIVEEEEHLLDEVDVQAEDDAEQNWREYLASQNIAIQGGKVTPEQEK